ncbi:MAG: TonB family protein [Bacteroidota bacterium]
MQNRLVDNRYRVVARIGQGAMGKVYKAEHVYTKRPVALKIIHPQFQEDEQYRVRFLREIELACRIQHPHAVQILDAGEAESRMLYMAMEFLEGQTLSNLLKQYPEGLNLDVAIRIACQIGKALETIHEAGLVHRDLKPDNIMVLAEPGAPLFMCNVKILDFGIARDVDGVNSITGEMMIGTPKFMSPEQTRGEKLTQQSDIYNLGLILYAMLTGKEPFKSDSPVGYVFHHNMTQPKPVTALRAGVPAHIAWAIDKALSKDPDERFESAEKFIATLTVGRGMFGKAAGRPAVEAERDLMPANEAGAWKKVMVATLAVVAVAWIAVGVFSRQSSPPAFAEDAAGESLATYDSSQYLVGPPAFSMNDLPIDSLYPVVITPNWDSLDPDMLDLAVQEAPAPVAEEPVTTTPATEAPATEAPAVAAANPPASTEDVSDDEVDPNVRYYLEEGRRRVRSPLSFEAMEHSIIEKPIEENSNIVRLREKQRTTTEVSEPTLEAPKDATAGATTLPRVIDGVESLRTKLRYPMAAVAARASGIVGVRVLIDETGVVIDEEVTQSLGYGCDEEVLRVLRAARFAPALVNNKPIKAWLNLQFSFQLVNSSN